jgi:hypothetical protein
MRFSAGATVGIVAVFLAGFSVHFLYQRWNSPGAETTSYTDGAPSSLSQTARFEPQSHRVTFVPLAVSPPSQTDLPLLQAREVEKIRALSGQQARIRGRIFRVGHSAKSNTFFLNFGPTREALTAVIFASAAELFEKKKMAPKSLEGKEVELLGEVKDHPQYGLEIVLENPGQVIKVVE